MSLMGEVLPGGRNGLFDGESGLDGVGEITCDRWASLPAVGFSLPASKTGGWVFELGGVVSIAEDCTSLSASLTGDRLRGFAGLSDQPYRDRSDELKFSPNGVGGPAGRGS